MRLQVLLRPGMPGTNALAYFVAPRRMADIKSFIRFQPDSGWRNLACCSTALPRLKSFLWKGRVFAIRAKARWLERCGTDLCANINRWLHLLCPFSFISNLFWRLSNKLIHLVAGCVMEGSMVFCKKNIPGHSKMFYGDYIKRCLLTIMVSQIL